MSASPAAAPPKAGSGSQNPAKGLVPSIVPPPPDPDSTDDEYDEDAELLE